MPILSGSLRFGRMLAIFTIVAFVSSLLAPDERWWGVDPGATGQGLYVLGVAALGVLIAWTVVSRALGARERGAVELDERDLRIRHAAVRFGDLTLTAGVVAGVFVLTLTPAEPLEWWLMPLIAAPLLIGVLIAKALAENVWLVLSYASARS